MDELRISYRKVLGILHPTNGGVICGWGSRVKHQGIVRAFDEAGVDLPATNPTRTRRIDFGLCHHLLWAEEVSQFEQSFSDHAIVAYNVNAEARNKVFMPPRVRSISESERDTVAARFAQVWCEQDFQQALSQNDTNLAWTLLSDMAEYALVTGEETEGHPRSLPWEPQPGEHARHKPNAFGHESESLKLLRRLCAQLRQLRAQPHVGGLKRSIARGFAKLRQIFGDLPFISLEEVDPVLEWTERLTEDLANQEKEAALHIWRERIVSNPAAASSWVKRKAEEALNAEACKEDVSRHNGPVHPATKLLQQAEVWTKHWTARSQELDYAKIQSALECLPQAQAHQSVQHLLSMHSLLAAAAKMRGKAPGPDRWAAEHFLLLPVEWWQAFHGLWQQILKLGSIPDEWKKVMVTLVCKPAGGTRPLGLCQIAWRIGARALNKCLKGWVLSWTGHGALGAAPTRGVNDAHSRLLLARKAGVCHFVKQDLSAFFDHIDVRAALMLMEKLGAPSDLCHLIKAFYVGQTRLFKLERYFSPQWISGCRGCVQGCPFSPTIALAFGHLWSVYCSTPHTDNLIYVDDRVLWPRDGSVSPQVALSAALHRSAEYDSIFGFKCRPSKCAVAQPAFDHTLDAFAAEHRYPIASSLEVLGVVLHFDGEHTSLLKLKMRELLLRLRYLRLCRPSLKVAKQVAGSLIASAMVWASGVAVPESQEIDLIRNELRAVLRPHFTDETPWFMVCAIHGWEWDPWWLCQWRALQAAWRFHTNPPTWLDTVPIANAFPTWMSVFPVATQAIADRGWEVSDTGRVITRVDAQGNLRSFEFGCDAMRILRHWLEEVAQQDALHRCGRVKRSLHRRDAGLAVGLDLPKPPPDCHFALGGHRLLGKEGPLEIRRAAHATGGTGWHMAAKLQLPSNVPTTCLCGALNPSRPHLVWSCSHTEHMRQGISMPVDRAQERLFAAPLPQYPAAPPPPLGQADVIDALSQRLAALAKAGGTIAVATDGSSDQGVGACAIATIHEAFVVGDGREDQTPFKYELLAILVLLRALMTILIPKTCKIFVLSDCQAALSAIQQPWNCCLPSWAHETASRCEQLRSAGCQLLFQWVPSHGKQPGWRPCCPLDANQCRFLNDKADEAANRCRKERACGSQRQQWFVLRERAAKWESDVIHIAAASAKMLQHHIANSRQRRDDASPPS